MLHKLKRNLILLNAILTGLILCIVVFGACIINIKQIKQNDLNNYMSLKETIEYKLQTENMIEDSWIADLEASDRLIIHIEDNGTPFLYQGSIRFASRRNNIVEEVKRTALTEGISNRTDVSVPHKMHSLVYSLKDDANTPFYASVSLIPVSNGYLSLTLVQFYPNERKQIIRQIFIFIGIDIIGILALTLVSSFFVSRTLKPVAENQKKQNEFIASASHDLRSPLAVIQTSASALLVDGSDPRCFVPIINNECTRMSRLIHDMLLLASSDTKSWQMQKEYIDTDTYLIELYDTFSTLCRKQDHSLSMHFMQDTLPKLYADKDRLTQVLGILIDNALCYSPAKSEIILRPYQKKASLILEVEDHGIGITKEQREQIFRRFYRADQSRNDISHFGLGLSIAKELVELHNGKISVKDTPGGGSTFVIELPAVS